jgi:putative hydrolase of HD superfamily
MRDILNYFFEIGILKRVKRSGWWVAGVKDPESVADHSFRAAVLAYIMADMEGANPEKACSICLFHDLAEARINDHHKISARYINKHDGEEKAFMEQLERLPKKTAAKIAKLYHDYDNDKIKESVIARDADLLECAIQAKEYMEIGHKEAGDWMKRIDLLLKTKTAKQLSKQLFRQSSHDWWQGLKKKARR